MKVSGFKGNNLTQVCYVDSIGRACRYNEILITMYENGWREVLGFTVSYVFLKVEWRILFF